jgi:channel protein (hemolysin III family)
LGVIQPFSIPGFTDPVSSFTHLIGAAVFLSLGVRLIRRGHQKAGDDAHAGANGWHTTSLAVFAFSCVLLLSVSGVFHLLPRGEGRDVLQILDHAAIFVLIAGTFTPIHAILFKGWMRWGVLGFVWAAAVTGITLKSVFFEGFPEALGIALYVGLGWVGVISMIGIWRAHGFKFGRRMVAAGLAYTVGAGVELLGWPTVWPGVVGPHEIFHVFVLIGVAWHFGFIEKIERVRPAVPPSVGEPDPDGRAGD